VERVGLERLSGRLREQRLVGMEAVVVNGMVRRGRQQAIDRGLDTADDISSPGRCASVLLILLLDGKTCLRKDQPPVRNGTERLEIAHSFMATDFSHRTDKEYCSMLTPPIA
jgi:hypothetical protein